MNRRQLPLNALRVFETVARHLSFTRSADYLCLTQGAVSRQILALEAYYGFALFTRHAKGLQLTPEAEQLLPAVQESFARLEEVSLRLTRQRTELSLKVPTCVMRWLLPKIMAFQTQHPEIQMQLTTTWHHDVDFRAEAFDAAIIYGPPPAVHISAIKLFDEALTPVCAPITFDNKPLHTPRDLAGHTLLHPTRDHRDWKMWLSYANANDISSTGGQSFETLDLATNAAVQGFGVAIGDYELVREDVESKRLIMPFRDTVLTTGAAYYLVYPDCVAHQHKMVTFSGWMTLPLTNSANDGSR